MLKPIIIVPYVNKDESELWALKNCLTSIRRFEPTATVFCIDSGTAPTLKQTVLDGLNVALLKRKSPGNREETINTAIRVMREKYGYNLAIIIDQGMEMKTPFVNACAASPYEITGCLIYKSDGTVLNDSSGTIEIPVKDSFQPSPSGKALFTNGAFHALKVDHLPYYCKTFKDGFSDIDLCLTAWLEGKSVGVLNEIVAVKNSSEPYRGFPVHRRKAYRWSRIHAAIDPEHHAIPLPF